MRKIGCVLIVVILFSPRGKTMNKEWKDSVVCPWCGKVHSKSEFTLNSIRAEIKKCTRCANEFLVEITTKLMCKTEKSL